MVSETRIHNNLVALTKNMAGGTPEEEKVHDDLTGIRQLAGNEAEAEIADVAQTLSFTTWIKDICDGVKQERELTVGTPGYNKNAESIRENIKNINDIGRRMGMREDIIEMPKPGYETKAAANAIYKDFALPYEAGAEIDYSKYMQMQEGKSSIARAMKKLSHSVAMNPQYGREAKAFWDAQSKAANNYNALAGEFLDGIEGIDRYQKEISEMKEFLKMRETSSDFDMGKVDFENDDAELRKSLSDSIKKAEKMIKTERGMLKAGHIDGKRRALFESTMHTIMNNAKSQQQEIKADDAVDVEKTFDMKNTMESERQYMEMVEKQKGMKPTFTMADLTDCSSKVANSLVDMNMSLTKAGVAPMPIQSKPMESAKIGKEIRNANNIIKLAENSTHPGMEPEYKGKKEPEKEIHAGEPEITSEFAKSIKEKSEDFVERMRRIVREEMLEEDEGNSTVNEDFRESVERCIGDVIDANGDVIVSAKQSGTLSNLSDTVKTGTGENVFDKDPDNMTQGEVNEYSLAVISVMGPMKDENGKYLPNFVDCYAVGEEVMPEPHKEYTDAMTSLMIIKKPETALAVRDSQKELIDLSQEYKELTSDKDLSHVEDDTGKYDEINKKAEEADDRMRKAMDVYRPLCMKLGIAGASALYQKSEFNKAWKESIRERNVQLMCQGTMQAMEESKRESERLLHDRLYGPHGLLR